MPKKKLVLIDGNSLLYRAFFALPTTLATSTGVITNAVYGFTSMLIRLIKDEKPDYLAVAFDKGIVTFRHEAFVEYKAHRPETPDQLRHQFDLAKKILGSLSIPVFEKEGFEADDILATAARQAQEAGNDVLVVTGDRDAFQLISDGTKVMATRRGITDIVIYDRKKLDERYGLPPEKIPDMIGLKGDPSDNIPGVPGVGEKTATKLIQQYGSLENVYSHLDEIKGEKLKENLRNYKKQAEVSKELATLHFETPVDFNINKCQLKLDASKARETFTELEFKTLFDRVKELVPAGPKEAGFEPKTKEATFKEIEPLLKKTDKIAVDFASGDSPHLNGKGTVPDKDNDFKGTPLPQTGTSLPLNMPSRGVPQKGKNVPIKEETAPKIFISFSFTNHQPPTINHVFLLPVTDLPKLKPYLEDKRIAKLAYDAKPLIMAFSQHKIRLNAIEFDAHIAAYLLEPTKTDYPPEEVAFKYLKINAGATEDKLKQAALKCYLAARLEKPLNQKLKENNLEKVYKELELPLMPILAAMEYRGVGIDKKELEVYSAELEQLINQLQNEIWRLAGAEFNISSPPQLSQILFETLGLKPVKKTKTGYSTDSSVLAKLINEHPIIENIINYRELTKLKSTYIDALPKLVNPKTGRLHTNFNQAVTATGRLSSSNPNLQNIPIRTEVGKRIRKAFIARPSDNLLIADYSQVELRVLAHLSKDKNLIKAFKEKTDIHQATASEVFGVPAAKVDKDMRRKAKAVNFGIVYGISGFGLASQLQISSEEAATYIELYFKRYPQVKNFIDETVSRAYKDGFVSTIYGRRRWLPELMSSDIRIRNFGERSAVNSVIQGSAADIIKQAMINIENALVTAGLMSRMVLQIHDELIFEVPSLENAAASKLIKKEMEAAYSLNPPLVANICIGQNWLETRNL